MLEKLGLNLLSLFLCSYSSFAVPLHCIQLAVTACTCHKVTSSANDKVMSWWGIGSRAILILKLCLSTMYWSGQSQSWFLIYFFFMLPRLEVGFLIYVKIELLNILKGFLKIAWKWQLRNWTTSQTLMLVVCLRTEWNNLTSSLPLVIPYLCMYIYIPYFFLNYHQ